MEIDVTKYEVNYQPFLAFVESNNGKQIEITRLITSFAINSYCPIIVIAHFALRAFGPNPEIERLISNLTEFYKYSKVIT